MKKPSKQRVFAILVLLALLIAIFPEVQSDSLSGKPSPDYGLYGKMEDMQDEKTSRYNSQDILVETEDRLNNMSIITGEERVDLKAEREIVSPNIPVPPKLGIYEAMEEWDVHNNSEIIDWLIPQPLAYYIHTKYITNTTTHERWTSGLLRTSIQNPSQWWDVDVDYDGTDDIEVFFDPELDWELGYILTELLDRLISGDPLELPVSLHYRVHKNPATTSFDIPGFENLEVHVAKSFSYDGKNFMVFLGFNFTNVVSYFNASVSISKVHLDGYIFNPTFPPSINLDAINLLALGGPYYLRWSIPTGESISSFDLEIATARIEFTGQPLNPYDFLNQSWVDVDFIGREPFLKVPNNGELMVEADDQLSSFDNITWNAQHECDVTARFFDAQQNVTYAEINIGKLVDEMQFSMKVIEKEGRNVSVINYEANGGVIEYLDIHHYEYFNVKYEDITKSKLDNGNIDYIHLFVNISHIPKKLYLEGVFYIEEVDPNPPILPGLGFIDEFVNSLVHRVISRFTRISKTLSSIPYKLLTISEEGTFATIDTFGLDKVNKVEFIFCSGDYIASYGDYIGFYNNTRTSNFPIAQISISGVIEDLWYFNSSFQDNVFAEVKMMSNKEFRAIYTDVINSVEAAISISNVPGHLIIFESPDLLSYNGVGTKIDEVRFLSDYQGNYMDLRILDLTDKLFVEFEDSRTHIYTDSPEKALGQIELLVTTGPIMRMQGNYLLVRHNTSYSMLSGRIKDIASLDYQTGLNGTLDIYFTQENPMNLSLLDERSEFLAFDAIIEPIPKHVKVNLSGFLSQGTPEIPLPHLGKTGVLGFVSVIFGIATMGNEIFALIDETTQNALNNIGNVLTELAFSYETETHLTFIGRILKGRGLSYEDVAWTHGICVKQDESGQDTSIAAKIYLTGLPTKSGISARIVGDLVFLDIQILDFLPLHNWLLVDVKGIQNRDVVFYINDIKPGMDLDLKVDITESLNTIPMRALGSVHMDSNEGVGAIYAKMRQLGEDISVTEMFLSSLPRELDTNFNLSGNITLNFNANRGIEYMFAKNSRTRNGEFHDIYLLLHEVPQVVNIAVTPRTNYDMDGSLLQTLPAFEVYTSESSLDAFIFADGKGIGQIGTAEIQMVNAPSEFSGNFSEGKYRLDSVGVDYFWIHVINIPVMEGQQLKSIEIVGQDMMSFDIYESRLFGKYPVINIENSKGGEIQFVIDHESDGSKIGFALIDFRSVNGIPSTPAILINGGAVKLDKGSSHTMVVMPVLTVLLSAIS